MSLFNHRLYIKVFLSINLIICFGVKINFSKSIQITNINNNNNNNNNHYLYEITVENNQKNINYDKHKIVINNLIPSTNTNNNNNINDNDNDNDNNKNNVINTPTNNNKLNIQSFNNDNDNELRFEKLPENYNQNNNNILQNTNENLKLNYENSPELVKENFLLLNDHNNDYFPSITINQQYHQQKQRSSLISSTEKNLNDNFWNFWKSPNTKNYPKSTTTTTTTTTQITQKATTNLIYNPFDRMFKIENYENLQKIKNELNSKSKQTTTQIIANEIESANGDELNRKKNELLLIRKDEPIITIITEKSLIDDKSLSVENSSHSSQEQIENQTENNYSNVVLANVTSFDVDDDVNSQTTIDIDDDDYFEDEQNIVENVIPSPPPYTTTESINNNINDATDDQYHQSCILGTAEFYLSWWLNADGSLLRSDTDTILAQTSLDLSFTARTTSGLADRIRQLRNKYEQTGDIVFLSAAHNNLTIVPNEALYLLNETLQYLSLAGNDFSKYITDGERDSCTWSYFPLMLHLRELDIRNCRITSITENAFINLNNLEKLFVAHNRIMHLQDNSFTILKHLQHLDLSFNDATIEIQAMEGVGGDDGGGGGGGNQFNSDYWTDLYNQMNDPFNRLSEGLKIDDNVFSELVNLRFLDFSNTKITPTSTRAFSTLPMNMELLSLCYTGLPIIPNGMFNGTNLKILDISGNPALAYQLNIDSFSGINDRLEILSVQNSNIKPLDWLHGLYNLKILQLATNNINQLTNETFKSLSSIEILDLNSNHISNWYYRIFENNSNLKVLKLRQNNINIMTTEMFKDFAELDYLAIGENSFLCNCILREFIDLAAINNREIICKTTFREIPNVSQNIQLNVLMTANASTINDNNDNKNNTNNNTNTEQTIDDHHILELPNNDNLMNKNLYNYIGHRLYHEHLSTFPVSFKNMDKVRETNPKYKMRMYINKNRKQRNRTKTTWRIYENSYINMFTNKFVMPLNMNNNNGLIQDSDDDADGDGGLTHNKLQRQLQQQQHQPLCKDENDNQTCIMILSARKTLNFTFQLLDFNEDDYTCINSTSNNEYLLTELENCFGDRTWDLSALRRTSNTLTFVLICLFIGFIIFIIIYYKWWYVRYFCIIIKNATILSFLDKDKNKFKNGLNADGDAFNYDVFVSYCQDNREWILEELLPNIERRTEINVCLHERDFQVGMSILENIISCMDRSRCLLLVVSQSFLLSQWCQFEMHLAQHRLLETRREHLILILLEDVPKRKRPKTLHYLMRTKTYIKWPVEDKRKSSSKNKENISRHLADERIVFWKRLRRALMDNDWENDNGSPA